MNTIFETLVLVFWFIIILVPLIVIHVFGHYIMSRLSGVKIPEFAVGFPLTKRLFYKKIKGTVWSFYPVLIGGFVRIWGDSDAIDEAFELFNDRKKFEDVRKFIFGIDFSWQKSASEYVTLYNELT